MEIIFTFKNGLNLENPITNESVDPYSRFFRYPVYAKKLSPALIFKSQYFRFGRFDNSKIHKNHR